MMQICRLSPQLIFFHIGFSEMPLHSSIKVLAVRWLSLSEDATFVEFVDMFGTILSVQISCHYLSYLKNTIASNYTFHPSSPLIKPIFKPKVAFVCFHNSGTNILLRENIKNQYTPTQQLSLDRLHPQVSAGERGYGKKRTKRSGDRSMSINKLYIHTGKLMGQINPLPANTNIKRKHSQNEYQDWQYLGSLTEGIFGRISLLPPILGPMFSFSSPPALTLFIGIWF